MLPQRISVQQNVGRSITSDLLRAMPGHWQLRELAGAYVNGNGRCLNVSSECRRPRAASALRCHPVGDRATMSITTRKCKRIYALGGERFISVIQQNDPGPLYAVSKYPLCCGAAHGHFLLNELVCRRASVGAGTRANMELWRAGKVYNGTKAGFTNGWMTIIGEIRVPLAENLPVKWRGHTCFGLNLSTVCFL